MNELRIRQRWVQLPLRFFIVVFALLFGGIGVYHAIAYPGEDGGFRIVIPAYSIQVYSAIALWWNWRTATITPAGVRVAVGPFPMSTPRSATKDKILYCYVHTVRVYSEDGGEPLETYENVGIETITGEQFTVSGPHMVAGEAMQMARQVAQVLAPIEMRVLDYEATRGRARRVLLNAAFWLALVLLAFFAGIAWDQEWWL